MKDGCELPCVGTENRTQVLCKSSVCSLTPEPSAVSLFAQLSAACLLFQIPFQVQSFAFLDLVSHFVFNKRPHGTSVENGAPSRQV